MVVDEVHGLRSDDGSDGLELDEPVELADRDSLLKNAVTSLNSKVVSQVCVCPSPSLPLSYILVLSYCMEGCVRRVV